MLIVKKPSLPGLCFDSSHYTWRNMSTVIHRVQWLVNSMLYFICEIHDIQYMLLILHQFLKIVTSASFFWGSLTVLETSKLHVRKKKNHRRSKVSKGADEAEPESPFAEAGRAGCEVACDVCVFSICRRLQPLIVFQQKCWPLHIWGTDRRQTLSICVISVKKSLWVQVVFSEVGVLWVWTS